MIEDVMFKCDGCGARELMHPTTAEEAMLDGAFGLKDVRRLDGTFDTAKRFTLEGSDRVLVAIPKGWDHRFGPKGTAFYHRCQKCKRKDVRFA